MTMKYLLLLLLIAITACNEAPKKGGQKTHQYKVKAVPITHTLHFTGNFQPLQEAAIINPMNGTIQNMFYHYGESVKKNDVIAIINSSELQKQYGDTLTEYLKAKDNFAIVQAKFIGSKNLWLEGLLSKNTYLSERSTLNSARVALMESQRKLAELLERLEESSFKNLSALSISDFIQVQKAFNRPHSLIYLKAPISGLLLYPPKASEDKLNLARVGAPLKAGQVLALVGDLSGVSIEIEVPEIDVIKLHRGMSANIIGVALEGEELKGRVVAVNAQTSETNTNGLPTFKAIIEVPSLTTRQQQLIKVGMSAEIELTVEDSHQLAIPIQAVKQQAGKSLVEILEKSHTRMQIVTTGSTLADQVVIKSGLKSGDIIQYE